MENMENEINIPTTPSQFPPAQVPKPKKGKAKLILGLVLLLAIVLGGIWRGTQREEVPYKSPAIYQPNPTDATLDQVSKAFHVATASSTLAFETAGVASEPVALSDLPEEIKKFLTGANEAGTYSGLLYKNGTYSLSYTTKLPLSENHAKLVISIDRDKEKLLQARSTSLASMIEIDLPTYQVRIIQDVVAGALTEVVLDAKPK